VFILRVGLLRHPKDIGRVLVLKYLQQKDYRHPKKLRENSHNML
jgi:hypothetical protein